MRVFTLIFVFSVFSGLVQAEYLQYRSDIRPKYYNDVWQNQSELATRIDYDPDKNQFAFYIKENLYLTSFKLSREQADSLIAAIDKYKEWNLKASKNGVTLEKEISKVEVSNTSWKLGDDWDFGGKSILIISFFSQSKQRHQLVVSFLKWIDRFNEFSTHTPETLYFDYDEAIKLKNALSEKAIPEFLEKAKKQAEIEAEFK
ncbi:MAG: hypothetical protein K8F34_00245 [Candidatus Kuenenia stuttgartiensis]|nr:hypothetical protein [Candidatus Kuenenia stuttgartiensis]